MSGMRKLLSVATVAVVAALTALGLGVVPTGHAAESQSNPVPPVAPALQEWKGGEGRFTLSSRARVVAHDRRLADEARTFAADLRRITGRRLPVEAGRRSHPGDLVLSLGDQAPEHREGYALTIGDRVTVAARQETGVSRGTQTVEQLFALDTRKTSIPRGSATDWPRLDERGFMMDAGRKYYQPSYIEQQIRTAAWYKLNTVHLHLTESEAFRLKSPKFPGLAPEQAYTKADIARFEAVAAKYHVTIVPEIDLPAHAGAIAEHWPETKWACESMNRKPYPVNLDVTKQATRDVAKELLDEFIPWFPRSPEFHVGADETPGQANLEECPELVDYAKKNGYANVADVNVRFIDYLDEIVRSHGKRTVIWNWWDVKVHPWKPNLSPTIDPNRDIKVEVWWNSEQTYLDKGYEVAISPYRQLYVVPGTLPGNSALVPNDVWLYGQWQPIDHPKLSGYLISRWTDRSTTESDAYHDWFAHRAQQVLADRAWGGPRAGSNLDYENRVDRIGPAPGVTDGYAAVPADGVRLTGTPYGTGPAGGGSEPTYDKVFDGDPGTFFDSPEANGGYAGLDLGHRARVTKVRIVPRSQAAADLKRMTGGKLQGCTEGPDRGCVDLATVMWRPPGYDWLQLPVEDESRYRWLRYLGPDGGHANVAEVEFWTKRQQED
ncbi:family 20 glycosylhydrolase [Streptomyces sp. KR80]|uniref:family 20 glycosylhydrolase n=1 Tax=Streptomyces sp. KR80 TaxID=3457426 RepID=UPI003FCFC01C